MGQIYNAVVDYLTEYGWHFGVAQEDVALHFGCQGRNNLWQCLCIVDEDKGFVRFYSIAPVNVPEEYRGAVSEFLTRANYGLPLGNFEMDYRDGEVRFKTSIDVEGGELTSTMIENLLKSNLTTMDQYLPGLMQVLYGNVAPAAAVEAIESNPLKEILDQLELLKLLLEENVKSEQLEDKPSRPDISRLLEDDLDLDDDLDDPDEDRRFRLN